MLLRFRHDRPVIDDRTARDGIGSVIDGNGRVDEIPIRIQVAGPQFGELTGAATDRVLVAVRAGTGVEDRSESGRGIVRCLVRLLVKCIRVARRLGNAVAYAFRSWALNQSGRIETGRSF